MFGMFMYYILALSIYCRSPAAYHAVKSLGILQLPCDKTLRGYMYKHAGSPGIDEEALLDRAKKYDQFQKERVEAGFGKPISQGILMWDEVKVQSRVIWNSSNSAIVGFAMSSDDFISLHDVYEGLQEDEKCQKTAYILQFLWRDLSSNFDIMGPYFTCASSIEMHCLHSMVVRTILTFSQFGLGVRALLCDGASGNLALLKLLCGHNNRDDIDITHSSFKSPFDGRRIHVIICPSHQVTT
jgi:hypothetical protein